MFLRLSCLLKCLSTLRRALWAMETTSVAVDETRFHISQCPRSCRRRDIIYKTIEHFSIKVYWHITEILTRRFSERSDDDSNSHCFLLLYIYKCRPLQSINVFSGFFSVFFFVCSSHSRTISSILYASVTYPRLEDVCLSKSVSKRDDLRAIANGESENVRKISTKCTT